MVKIGYYLGLDIRLLVCSYVVHGLLVNKESPLIPLLLPLTIAIVWEHFIWDLLRLLVSFDSSTSMLIKKNRAYLHIVPDQNVLYCMDSATLLKLY